MRKRGVGLYRQLGGVLGSLAPLGKDRPPHLHPLIGLTLPTGRRTQNGNNKGWRILRRELWLPHCHPLGPLEPLQGGQSTMPRITHLCVLVPVDIFLLPPFWQSCIVTTCWMWQLGISKCLPESVDPHTLSEVMGILSYISHRGNCSMQRSFIQGSGAAGNGGECLGRYPSYFPDFSSQRPWVLILNPCFLKAPTVSNNSSSKKSRY